MIAAMINVGLMRESRFPIRNATACRCRTSDVMISRSRELVVRSMTFEYGRRDVLI